MFAVVSETKYLYGAISLAITFLYIGTGAFASVNFGFCTIELIGAYEVLWLDIRFVLIFLNEDGSVNYQTGEVDILVNFRTPVDLNQATGLYNFGGASKSAPVLQFSGLYYVNTIVSNFKQGKFTQNMELNRVMDKPTEAYGVKPKKSESEQSKTPPVNSGANKN